VVVRKKKYDDEDAPLKNWEDNGVCTLIANWNNLQLE